VEVKLSNIAPGHYRAALPKRFVHFNRINCSAAHAIISNLYIPGRLISSRSIRAKKLNITSTPLWSASALGQNATYTPRSRLPRDHPVSSVSHLTFLSSYFRGRSAQINKMHLFSSESCQSFFLLIVQLNTGHRPLRTDALVKHLWPLMCFERNRNFLQ
jgi:hypothetical protein